MRWKFFIPFAVIMGGVAAFYAFVMDGLTARVMEISLEKVFNARAEVSGVDLSLISGRARIGKITVADADNHMSNLFEAGNLELNMPVKALLMKRLVIEEASLKDISWGTPRKESGALKKVSSPDEVKKKKIKSAGEEPEKKNLLPISDIKAAGNDYFEKQKDMFKTPKLAEEAKVKSEALKNKWDPILGDTDAKLKKAGAAAEEIKKIDTAKLKKIPEIAEALKTLRVNSKEIKSTAEYVKGVKKEFDSDKTAVAKLKRDIIAARESDWKLVSAQLNVPVGSQFQSFTQNILSGILYKKMGSFAKYIEKVIAISAKMKEQEKKKTPPKPEKKKFKGRDVAFKSMLFPKFHLKHAGISVKKETLELSGELVNFRTSPENSKNPATFKLSGDESGKGIKISGIIDNRERGSEKSKIYFRGNNFPLDDIGETIPSLKIKTFSGIYSVDIDYISEAGQKPELKLVIRIRNMKATGDESDIVTGIVI
ncbi:TIGR03545 family protein, partial [bacterium]|nr:TIGR03545 family protein [bacterium]